jgi:hypothetical protein
MKKINARVVTDQETLPNQGIDKKCLPHDFSAICAHLDAVMVLLNSLHVRVF